MRKTDDIHIKNQIKCDEFIEKVFFEDKLKSVKEIIKLIADDPYTIRKIHEYKEDKHMNLATFKSTNAGLLMSIIGLVLALYFWVSSLDIFKLEGDISILAVQVFGIYVFIIAIYYFITVRSYANKIKKINRLIDIKNLINDYEEFKDLNTDINLIDYYYLVDKNKYFYSDTNTKRKLFKLK